MGTAVFLKLKKWALMSVYVELFVAAAIIV
jgi:hypothetical protein